MPVPRATLGTSFVRGDLQRCCHGFCFAEWRAAISGPWKWITFDRQWDTEQRGQKVQTHLFNLAEDPGEKKNLAESQRDQVSKLNAAWTGWRADIEPESKPALQWARRRVDNVGKLIDRN